MLRPRPLACITILGAGVAATAVVACQLDTGGFGVTSTSAEPAASSTGSGAPEGSTSGSGSASGTGPTSGAPTTDPPSATSTGDTGDTGDDLPDPDTSTTDPDPPAGCGPILAEVLTSLDDFDDGREWVVLHNPCEASIELAPLSLAWGNTSYAGSVGLQGAIPPGGCLTVGGPTSNGGNFNPSIHQPVNFEPNLSRNPGAIGLFALAPEDVSMDDVPLDAVVYGDSNQEGFLDSTGAVALPVLRGNTDLVSMRRTSLGPTWEFANPPTPQACPSF